MNEWIAEWAGRIAEHAPERALELCSIPSVHANEAGAERALGVLCQMLPPEAEVTRLPSSTPGFASDLVARIGGSGRGRLLLLGHIDTVSEDTARAAIRGGRLLGPGAYDMKGGLVLAAGVLEALASSPGSFELTELLVVCDEEWREHPLVHSAGAADRYDACLCFEGGEDDGAGVITRRKGSAVVRVRATGRASHAGAAPDEGRSALIALSRLAPELALSGPDGLVATPTILSSGESLNTIPPAGELVLDVRAFEEQALRSVAPRVPAALGEVSLEAETVLRFPPMDTRERAAPVLQRAGSLLGGREIGHIERGGSSDAAFFAQEVPLTVDGLGPLGGADHGPEEHALVRSFAGQAQLALAIALAAAEDAAA